MSICFPYSLKYSELSNWVFLCMICDNYLFVRIVYNYVTCVEGSFTRIFSFLCIQMYQTFLLLLLGFVPYQEGSSPFWNHTYKKKKSSIVFSLCIYCLAFKSLIHLEFILEEDYGRSFTLFFLQCCLSQYKLLNFCTNDLKYQPFPIRSFRIGLSLCLGFPCCPID